MAPQTSEVHSREQQLLSDLEIHAESRRERGRLDRDTGRQTVKRWLKRPGGPRRNLRFWREQLRVLRGPAEGISLASLPLAPGSPALAWAPNVRVSAVARTAAQIDPPSLAAWDLTLDAPRRVSGEVALSPRAWSHYPHAVTIELRAVVDGEVQWRWSATLQSARWDDRRWVPWSGELPAGRVRLEVESMADPGHLDWAWTLCSAPVLETPGRPPALDRALPEVPAGTPKISILMPVHDPPLPLLEAALQSVFAQDDPCWQLCITDDGSKDVAVQERLRRAAAEEPRVSLARNEQAQNISGATNVAFTLVEHEFIATMDHDDLLHPDAIRRMRAAIAANPGVDALYSDNDLTAGEAYRFSASLKPNWSPDHMRACMYTLHFSVYRRSMIEQIGGWRSEFDGAQDHDLVLRLAEHTDRVVHVPHVLYSWRAHPGSAALSELAKPSAYDRGKNAVLTHVERLGHAGADVERLATGGFHVHYPVTEPVTIVLVGASAEERAAWTALAGDPADVREVPVSDDPRGAVLAATEDLPASQIVVVVEVPSVPVGDAVVRELAGHVQAGAAAAGGLMITADRHVATGALVFPQGVPVTLQPDFPLDFEYVPPVLRLASNRLAVRGVVAARLSLLRDATIAAGRLGIAAATMEAGERGERIVFSPHAEAQISEAGRAWLSEHRLADLAAMDRGARHDPFYSPAFRPGRAFEAYDEVLIHGYEQAESVRNWLR